MTDTEQQDQMDEEFAARIKARALIERMKEV